MKGEDDEDIVRWLDGDDVVEYSDEKFAFGFGSPVSYPALMPGRVVIRNREKTMKMEGDVGTTGGVLRLARKNLLPEGGFLVCD
jgi:hypothetical protein